MKYAVTTLLLFAGLGPAQEDPMALHQRVVTILEQRIEFAVQREASFGDLAEAKDSLHRDGRASAADVAEARLDALRARDHTLQLRVELARARAPITAQDPEKDVLTLLHQRLALAQKVLEAEQERAATQRAEFEAGRVLHTELVRTAIRLAEAKDLPMQILQRITEVKLGM